MLLHIILQSSWQQPSQDMDSDEESIETEPEIHPLTEQPSSHCLSETCESESTEFDSDDENLETELESFDECESRTWTDNLVS
jgi:hypothetical protein